MLVLSLIPVGIDMGNLPEGDLQDRIFDLHLPLALQFWCWPSRVRWSRRLAALFDQERRHFAPDAAGP